MLKKNKKMDLNSSREKIILVGIHGHVRMQLTQLEEITFKL